MTASTANPDPLLGGRFALPDGPIFANEMFRPFMRAPLLFMLGQHAPATLFHTMMENSQWPL